MAKKKVLFVAESHKLASGFGTYANEILPLLHATGKYELAEFACYSSAEMFSDTDWLIYANAPSTADGEAYDKEHTSNTAVQWGITRLEYAILDFKPDVVLAYRDPWMDAYIADSSLLPFFNWVWMPTVDSAPQKTEWLHWFNRCDKLLTYSEFGVKTLKDQTRGRLSPEGCASPFLDYTLFDIVADKKKHKASMGLDPESFIVGSIMRNQKRKMFPELMKSFKRFTEEAPKEISERAFLYLHTSHPERFGWDITSLTHEYGLGSKLLCTYTCQGCSKFFISHYRDAISICSHCGRNSAVLPGVTNGLSYSDLPKIYNVMDLYVQYAITEGFGYPVMEAAACGVPTAAIDYSAMEDTIHHTKGYPIKANLARELETNADRSGPNNDALVKIFHTHSKKTPQQIKKMRLEARKGCKNRYTAKNAVKAWEEAIDNSKNKLPWNHPRLMRLLPAGPPEGLSNQQFCEWICSSLVQDEYHLFNYKMLSMLRDLNFGASVSKDMIEKCDHKTLFEENASLAKRRLHYDMVRCGDLQVQPPRFITEAHNRMKK